MLNTFLLLDTKIMLPATQRQLKIIFLMMCYFFNFISKLINFFEKKTHEVSVGGPDQRRLLRFLMNEKQHDSLERPVKNDSETIPVKMNLALQQIINFVSKIKIISFSDYVDSGIGWQK